MSFPGQRYEITISNFFLHVLNHALKRFVINSAINFFNKNNLFKGNEARGFKQKIKITMIDISYKFLRNTYKMMT